MRKSAVVLTAALTVTASLFIAGPAEAALPGDSGKLTMWGSDSYKWCSEARVSYDSNFSNDQCDYDSGNGPVMFDDQLSSFVNKTSNWWILFEDRNYEGARICVRPKSYDANIGNDTGYEDDISSVEKRGTDKPTGCKDTTGTAYS